MLPVWNRTRIPSTRRKSKPHHVLHSKSRHKHTSHRYQRKPKPKDRFKSLRNMRFHDKVDDSGSESHFDSAITESYVCSCLNTSSCSCDSCSSDDDKRVYTITQPGSAGSLTTSSEDSKQLPPSCAPPFPSEKSLSIGKTS